jgi:hypothetical protein
MGLVVERFYFFLTLPGTSFEVGYFVSVLDHLLLNTFWGLHIEATIQDGSSEGLDRVH